MIFIAIVKELNRGSSRRKTPINDITAFNSTIMIREGIGIILFLKTSRREKEGFK